MELDPKQIEAVELCLKKRNRIVAVTGGPGNGKTQTMQFVYEELHRQGVSVIATAPTGKAADRIKEVTGIDAVTIHRLLEYPRPTDRDDNGKALQKGVPRRNRMRPIEYDVVLADEYPMVGDELHRNLVHALPPGGRLCVFGDVNQLRPIEGHKALIGQPSNFEKILNSTEFPSVRLERNYRTGAGALIAQNAARILRGEMPINGDGYSLRTTWEPLKELTALIREDVKKWCSLDNQIMVPMKKSWIGTEKLNATLQQTIFQAGVDRKKGHWIARHPWCPQQLCLFPGDKIIYTQNNYELEVFNGETGTVVEIDYKGDVIVDFGNRIVRIPETMHLHTSDRRYITVFPTKDIELAYAITTHKCQGSEYNEAIYLMGKSTQFMCDRRNFYTSNTRPRQQMTTITDHAALSKSLYDTGNLK